MNGVRKRRVAEHTQPQLPHLHHCVQNQVPHEGAMGLRSLTEVLGIMCIAQLQ